MSRGRRPDLPPTRRGYSPYEVVSAFQKAIRRSQVREAVYWGFEMWASGYDAWIWARVKEILSEDIGPADRYLPATIAAIEATSKHKKKTKGVGGMEFVHAVILLATAPKCHAAVFMVHDVSSDDHERLEIPDEALDRHTRAGRHMGRDWEHWLAEGAKLVQPDEVHPDGVDGEIHRLTVGARERFAERCAGKRAPSNKWRPKGPNAGESWLPAPAEPKGDVQTEMKVDD